jgi:hypothetical protein
VSVETRQLVHLYLSTTQETFDSDTCRQRDWNVRECHHTWSAVLDRWSFGQEIRHVVFQASFVILPCKPVLKYAWSE